MKQDLKTKTSVSLLFQRASYRHGPWEATLQWNTRKEESRKVIANTQAILFLFFENFSRADGVAAVKPLINHSLCLAETTQMCHNKLAAQKIWLHISRCNKLYPVAVCTAPLSQKCCPWVIIRVCVTPAGRRTATSNQQKVKSALSCYFAVSAQHISVQQMLKSTVYFF